MDDLTKKRLENEQAAAVAAAPDIAFGVDAAMNLPADAFNAEIARILGADPVAVGFGFGYMATSHFVGMACGMMTRVGLTLVQALAVVDSVATHKPAAPYDICADDDTCGALAKVCDELVAVRRAQDEATDKMIAESGIKTEIDKMIAESGIKTEIAPGVPPAETPEEYDARMFDNLTLWARYMRIAINEMFFAIENVFPPDEVTTEAELLRRSAEAVRFVVTHTMPVLRAAADAGMV